MEYFDKFNKFLEIYERISQEQNCVIEHLQFYTLSDNSGIYSNYFLNNGEEYKSKDCCTSLRIYKYIKKFIKRTHPNYVEQHVFINNQYECYIQQPVSHFYTGHIYPNLINIHIYHIYKNE